MEARPRLGGPSLHPTQGRWVDALVCHAVVVLPGRSRHPSSANLLGLTRTPKIRFVKLAVDRREIGIEKWDDTIQLERYRPK